MIQNSKFVDLPVISNALINGKLVPLTTLKTGGITEAFEIIDAAKLTNAEILERLSEINLRDGGDTNFLRSQAAGHLRKRTCRKEDGLYGYNVAGNR